MENENLKDRIKEIMDSKHMNNKVFATETGINEGTLSLLLRGKTQPTLKHYEAIHTRFPDIAMEWLFDGKGQCTKIKDFPNQIPTILQVMPKPLAQLPHPYPGERHL